MVQKIISESKKETVKELSNLTKSNRTVLIVSIKDIPTSQFQEIRKKLRGKAIIRVPKKSMINRALDSIENENIKKLKIQIKEDVAVLFSKLDSFELASELVENKRPAKAKAGQEAPENVEISAGPTDLVPGPAISELESLGIKIQITGGKIAIKESKILVRKGEKISREQAGLMNRLDIKPFSVGFIPLAAFDSEENKIYLEIKIDREGVLKELKNAFAKALPFAVEIGYVSNDTIGFLLQKAERNANALGKFAEIKISESKEDDNKEQTDKVKQTSQESSESLTEKSSSTPQLNDGEQK